MTQNTAGVDVDISELVNELDEAGEERLYQALHHFWHPVAYSSELTDKPMRVVLLDKTVVIARLNDKAHAYYDLCMHRGAAISQGEIEDGCIRCVYHGWKYDSTGQCIEIPSRPELSTLTHAKLTPYLCEERYGIIWVCITDDPQLDIPELHQWDDPSFRFIPGPITEWRCASPRRLENYVDFGHFSWVHDGYLGSREKPEVTDHDVEMVGGEMQVRQVVHEPVTGKFKAHLGAEGDMITAENVYRVFLPHAVNLDRHFDGGGRYILFMAPSPVGRKQTRSFWYIGRNYAIEPENDAEFLDFEAKILEQDKPVVEGQRPEQLPLDLTKEMHIRVADKISLNYRRALIKLADDLVPGSSES
jgi:phenylpropionate dioxygenase-like ring-hydroxylating dioxygenase large terminal subunit